MARKKDAIANPALSDLLGSIYDAALNDALWAPAIGGVIREALCGAALGVGSSVRLETPAATRVLALIAEPGKLVDGQAAFAQLYDLTPAESRVLERLLT